MSQSLVPTPPQRDDVEEAALEVQAQSQRQRLETTLDRLKSRLEDKRARVDELQDDLQNIDDDVRRLRWPLVGAALVIGALVGRRRASPAPQVYLLPASTDEYAMPAPKKAGFFRSALGAVAGHMVRRAITRWLG